jgi:hypothetical protein
MAYRLSSLPRRFPVGTKFVIEGQSRGEGQLRVSKRYLEFPDGTFMRLPVQPAGHEAARQRAPRKGVHARAKSSAKSSVKSSVKSSAKPGGRRSRNVSS